MAKVILKWRYIKPGTKKHNSNLVKYIAQRHNVDKIDDTWQVLPVSESQQDLIAQILKDFPEATDSHEYQDYCSTPNKGTASEFISRSVEDNFDRISKRSNYVRYIAHRPGAERFGTHGLFTDANIPINLNAVADEVAEHKGILLTEVLSIRREDAVRLGFDKGEAWRDMLRSQTTAMAQAMNIPLEDLRWYAAFHNESHHPHCHIVAYSVGKNPYMSQQDLIKLKKSFAHEIFKHDMLTIYQEQTRQRDFLKAETKDQVKNIVSAINSGNYQNPKLEEMLRELSNRLKQAKGKKMYGYLLQPTRNLVNNIIDELAKDERLSELYDLWYTQRDAVVATYQSKKPNRLPLSQNKTFHSIRNVVVQEAMNLSSHSINQIENFRKEKGDIFIDWGSIKTTTDETEKEIPVLQVHSDSAQDEEYDQVHFQDNQTQNTRVAVFRLLTQIAQIFQQDIDQREQKSKHHIDWKLRQKIEEKKKAQGLKMG